MNPPTTPAAARQYYCDQLERQEAEVAQCAGRWRMFSYLRGGLFFAFAAPALMGLANAWGIATLLWCLAGVLFGAFLIVVILHERMQATLIKGRMLSRMHRESIARCDRNWSGIKAEKVDVPNELLATSKDLDLFGPNSVFCLLGITRTPLGTETLRQWIIQGALPEEVSARQEAVAELKPEFEWRLKFRTLCEQLAASRSGPSRFVEWSESPSWFANGRQWVLWLARLTSLTILISIGLLILGVLTLPVVGPVVIVSALINFALSVFYAGSMHEVFNQVSSQTNDALLYVELFDMVADYPAKSERLLELQSKLKRSGDGAQTNVQRLGLLVFLANLRRNGMFFLIFIVCEFLFFWDAHALDLLERWKAKNGSRARGWFGNLGQWEALCALAKLAGDQPDWVFPTVANAQESTLTLVGVGLGHPLLDENRVANDVQVGPPGTVLLVTGSNMSGKSTLLRSVGVNAVLAQMGSVVCAQSMSMPPLHIETSMRIADSLADGVSFFMAELKRLKSIVDVAKSHAGDNPRRFLFLLDEILQGTNSRERQIAVSRVVRKLIDEQAIGAISTHDLDLAATPELAEACQPVHFAEQFAEVDGKKVMTFDYQMRAGIAETTNALKLLEMVGLGPE